MTNGNAGFDELLVQLRAGNSLLAALLQKQHDLNQGELIGILAQSNMPATEIAQIVGTTQNTVQVTLSRKKNKRK